MASASWVSPLHIGHAETFSTVPAEFSLLVQQDLLMFLFSNRYTSKVQLLLCILLQICHK